MNRFLLAVVVLGAGGCTSRMPAQVVASDSIVYRRSTGGLGPGFRQSALTLRGDGSVEYVTGSVDHLGADGNLIMERRTRQLEPGQVAAAFGAFETAGLFQLKNDPPPPDAGGQGISARLGDRRINASWPVQTDEPVGQLIDSLLAGWFPPEATTPADTNAVGTIQGDCAPWDGSAVAVTLPHDSAGPNGQLRFSVWKSPSEADGGRWSVGSGGKTDGVGRLCDSHDRCVNVHTGTVEFEHLRVGGATEGRYRLILEDGRELVGRFVARWVEQRVLCG